MVEVTASLVPAKNEQHLTDKQRVDYEILRRDSLEWVAACRKGPASFEEYAENTIERTPIHCANFNRFVWDHKDGYLFLTHKHADAYLRSPAGATRRYVNNGHSPHSQKRIK